VLVLPAAPGNPFTSFLKRVSRTAPSIQGGGLWDVCGGVSLFNSFLVIPGVLFAFRLLWSMEVTQRELPA